MVDELVQWYIAVVVPDQDFGRFSLVIRVFSFFKIPPSAPFFGEELVHFQLCFQQLIVLFWNLISLIEHEVAVNAEQAATLIQGDGRSIISKVVDEVCFLDDCDWHVGRLD